MPKQKKIGSKRKLPETPAQWMAEIILAFEEALKTQPLTKVSDTDLYRFAPIVCLDFRGMNYRDEALQRKVAEGAYMAYIVSCRPENAGKALKADPLMGFTLCYVTSHVVLDIIDEEQADEIMDYCVEHFDDE